MPTAKRKAFFDNAVILLGIVGIFWAVEILDVIFKHWHADQYGIQPRTLRGLGGIFAAPFLHGNFQHLIGNTIPFLALGGMVLLAGRTTFAVASFIITVVAGLGIWVLGTAGTVHIGASTLVFGYLAFLLWRGWLSRDWRWLGLALIAGFLYGGLVITLFKRVEGISWTGHAFGFVGGAVAAWLLTGNRANSPKIKA